MNLDDRVEQYSTSALTQYYQHIFSQLMQIHARNEQNGRPENFAGTALKTAIHRILMASFTMIRVCIF